MKFLFVAVFILLIPASSLAQTFSEKGSKAIPMQKTSEAPTVMKKNNRKCIACDKIWKKCDGEESIEACYKWLELCSHDDGCGGK